MLSFITVSKLPLHIINNGFQLLNVRVLAKFIFSVSSYSQSSNSHAGREGGNPQNALR